MEAGVSASPDTGVIITGGASGIGFATAAALADGGRPVAIWDLGEDRVNDAGAKLAASEVPVAALVVDVTDHASFEAAIDKSRRAMGSIGGLVHAAGNIFPEPIDEVEWPHWASQMEVHLNAYARLVQAVLADLRAHAGSAIIAISSINGLVGNMANPAYCAAKAGMLGLNRSLTARLGPDGIRVNGICPGYIDTPMIAGSLTRSGARDHFVAASSLGRLGRPEEIGRVARFLLSDDASFLTGQAIAVDGGVTTTV
jgi:NAD(P)-dependent dehydrogenase (short-subunit alcohol dehydrogenase family)